MTRPSADIQYLDHVDLARVPDGSDFLIESHRPHKFRVAYHSHPSVEVNFLIDCEMTYTFSGTDVIVPEGRIAVFWGAIPHAVSQVADDGWIINIYLSFARLTRLGLPAAFTDRLLDGAVLIGRHHSARDPDQFKTWLADSTREGPAWQALVLDEVGNRLRRLALEGVDAVETGGASRVGVSGATVQRVGDMLQFIAANFASPITVSDVAAHAGISSNHAMSLFRRAVGTSIKAQLTRTRLSHAQMLLANTEKTVVSVAMDSGFGSLSSFYEAFQAHMHSTPAEFRKAARQ